MTDKIDITKIDITEVEKRVLALVGDDALTISSDETMRRLQMKMDEQFGPGVIRLSRVHDEMTFYTREHHIAMLDRMEQDAYDKMKYCVPLEMIEPEPDLRVSRRQKPSAIPPQMNKKPWWNK